SPDRPLPTPQLTARKRCRRSSREARVQRTRADLAPTRDPARFRARPGSIPPGMPLPLQRKGIRRERSSLGGLQAKAQADYMPTVTPRSLVTAAGIVMLCVAL